MRCDITDMLQKSLKSIMEFIQTSSIAVIVHWQRKLGDCFQKIFFRGCKNYFVKKSRILSKKYEPNFYDQVWMSSAIYLLQNDIDLYKINVDESVSQILGKISSCTLDILDFLIAIIIQRCLNVFHTPCFWIRACNWLIKNKQYGAFIVTFDTGVKYDEKCFM